MHFSIIISLIKLITHFFGPLLVESSIIVQRAHL